MPGDPTQGPTPLDEPRLGGLGGSGKTLDQKLRTLGDTWGTLPAADRARAVSEITRDLPPKYRPMIEEYFRAMNRIHGYGQ